MIDDNLLSYFDGNELAANAWLSKYAQQDEKTPDDMHWRLAEAFEKIEHRYQKQELENQSPPICNSLSHYGRHRDMLNADDIYGLFKDFKYIIPQGSIMSQLGADSIGSLSNCFVVGQPYDSYGGIFQKDEETAQLMKRRGGVGIDISTLRPQGTSTSNAAKSSTGAVSFMHRYSNTTREVAQNGRRGALMISIDINHPDVLEFIKIKRDLSQVTGANISIKLNDEFMKAVENDEDYILRFPCDIKNEDILIMEDSKYIRQMQYDVLEDMIYQDGFDYIKGYFKKIKARKYWNEIIKSAHNVAEPGLMFWDNMVEYSPDGIYKKYRQITTNPCSEIGMQPYDACRLIAVNLFSFVKNPFTPQAEFDFELFYKINYEAMRLSDDLVDLELEHIQRIIDKIDNDPEPMEVKLREKELWKKIYATAESSRRTGLGFTALGDALAALGLKYDSDEALCMIENIMDAKMASELDCTIDLAILRGTFDGWNTKTENYLDNGQNSFYKFIQENFPEQYNKMSKYGRRNVSWSTVAPTGTVSLMTQTTSGIEPLFMPFYIRRKKINPNDEGVRVDFVDETGDSWQEFPVLHPKFRDWYILNKEKSGMFPVGFGNHPDEATKEELEYAFKNSPWYGSTANDIDWVRRVEIQGVIQKYITHSISSTINLPSDVSEEEVSKIYMESWKKGLKGITVYRDGSRSGVLVSNTINEPEFKQNDAPKRPKVLPCKVHQSTTKGEHFLIVVGLFDDKPYEVFCIPNNYNLPQGILEGDMIKVRRGKYNLDIRDIMTIDDVTRGMTPIEEAMTRLVSTSLRHGADIRFIVEQLGKSDDSNMFSFTRSLARVLKKYIPDGAKATVSCNDCGSDNVIFEEGCHKCLDCGASKCG